MKAGIFNLTQNPATEEQVKQGVIEPNPILKEEIKKLLTFEELPKPEEIRRRAHLLAELATKEDYGHAMIGGAGFLMSPLEQSLFYLKGIKPYHSFTGKEGKHVGFVSSLMDV